MKLLKVDFVEITHSERGILANMIVNLLLSLALLIFALAHLNPNSAVIKIGYGDIGGYRDGAWENLLAFPLLAIIFGIFHNVLALRIYHKRGSGMTKFFLLTTTMLIAGTFVVLLRLLGEG